MKIKATVYPVKTNQDSNLLAFASIEINDEFVVTGIKVLSGSKGLFIGFPSAKDKNGEYRDVCFPLTKELRQDISDTVLKAYRDMDEKPNTRSRKR